METMGKKWVFGIGLYLILKGVLNLILGFSVSNIIMLIVGVVALVLMLNRVPYINYIVAVFLAIMFLTHIGANLSNLGSQWIYLLEGLLDLGAAAVLVFEKNVKAFFGKLQRGTEKVKDRMANTFCGSCLLDRSACQISFTGRQMADNASATR